MADAASALIAKWCAHYNSTAPPVSPSAKVTQEVVDLTQENRSRAGSRPSRGRPRAESPAPARASVSFEDDEILRKAARKFEGTARVSKIAQAPSAEPARQEASATARPRGAVGRYTSREGRPYAHVGPRERGAEEHAYSRTT